MKKVHIVVWAAKGSIGCVHADHEKACEIAKKANKKIGWFQRLSGAITSVRTEWIVQTFDVKGT